MPLEVGKAMQKWEMAHGDRQCLVFLNQIYGKNEAVFFQHCCLELPGTYHNSVKLLRKLCFGVFMRSGMKECSILQLWCIRNWHRSILNDCNMLNELFLLVLTLSILCGPYHFLVDLNEMGHIIFNIFCHLVLVCICFLIILKADHKLKNWQFSNML